MITPSALVATLSAGVLAAGTLLGVATPAAASASSLTVSATGTGSACTATAPCTLATGLAQAHAGADITMLAGHYGAQHLMAGGGVAGSPVAVAAEPGVTLTRLETHIPHVTFTGQRITAVLYVHPPARGTTIEGVHLDGGGSFIRSSNVTVRDSLFEGGRAIDAIQVKDARDILIERNVVRDYDEIVGSEVHVDCVQVFESHAVTIRANQLRNCSNSGVILSPGTGAGSSDIVIESNFIQGCTTARPGCRGGAALEAREPTAVNTVIRNNTIGSGATRIGHTPGLVFDRNLVQYLFDCNSPMTNTIVNSWNTAMCSSPSRLGVDGNRHGTVSLVDQRGGDLRLLDAAHAEIPAKLGLRPAPSDIDGNPFSRFIAGAHSPVVATPPPAATPAPDPVPVPDAGVPTPRVAGPAGSGTACTTAAPCSLVTAVERASPGEAVTLLAGDYGSPTVAGAGGSADAPITVTGASGAASSFGKLTLATPHVTWSGILTRGGLATTEAASGTVLDGVQTLGAGLYLTSSDTVVRNSVLRDGSGGDGIQVRGAHRISIESTSVENFGGAGDCLQIVGGGEITVRDVALTTCGGSGILLTAAPTTVLIEGASVADTGRASIDVREGIAVTLSGTTSDGTVLQ